MAYSYSAKANPTSQQKPQSSQQQQAPQAAPQQQASPFKAPDMSAYAQPSGGYNAYNVPRTAPKGAQQNDLSGNVPSNQVFAQAYNQASKQSGGNTQAQSFTMPGTFTSQGYNPATGQYGQMTGGQSFDGNMAYNAIDSRPGPIQSSATGVGGNPMQWQDAMAQQQAFVGNLSQRLGQYSGGQLTGPVTFDPSQLMSQANDQLAKGTFSNPFSQNPDVQQAMGNATQYMQGNFQNPFGNSPQANNPQPSWHQQSYDPQRQDYNAPAPSGPIQFAPVVNAPPRPDYSKPYDATDDNAAAAAGWQKGFHGGAYNSKTGQYWDGSGAAPWAQQPPKEDASLPAAALPSPGQWAKQWASNKRGGREATEAENEEESRARKAMESGWYPGSDWDNGYFFGTRENAGRRVTLDEIFPPSAAPSPPPSDTVDSSQKSGSARPIEPPPQGTPYDPQAQSQGLPDVPQPTGQGDVAQSRRGEGSRPASTDYTSPVATPERQRAIDSEKAQSEQARKAAMAGMQPQPSARQQAQLAKIDKEINQWQRATYGTRTGGGPPAEWYSHIQALQRLRTKAAAGDAAALAWSPKMKAPPANVTPTVPVNRRGSAARFGGLMQNGDNRR